MASSWHVSSSAHDMQPSTPLHSARARAQGEPQGMPPHLAPCCRSSATTAPWPLYLAIASGVKPSCKRERRQHPRPCVNAWMCTHVCINASVCERAFSMHTYISVCMHAYNTCVDILYMHKNMFQQMPARKNNKQRGDKNKQRGGRAKEKRLGLPVPLINN